MILVFDLETTGLHPDNACVWDFACVAVKDGEIVSQFQSHVQPCIKRFSKPHRDVVQRVSGLTESELLELLDAPSVADVRTAYYEWRMEQMANWEIPNTSYNREFDFRFLTSDDWKLHCIDAPCIMNTVTDRVGKRISLSSACLRFGVERSPEELVHRALADAVNAAKLAIKLGMG
jgi:DNA polymerase III epsilon subunit-like protein